MGDFQKENSSCYYYQCDTASQLVGLLNMVSIMAVVPKKHWTTHAIKGMKYTNTICYYKNQLPVSKWE